MMKLRSIVHLVLICGLPLTTAAAQQYEPTLLELLQNDGRFTTFLHLAKACGADSYLKSYSATGTTVVAPTNDAFAKLPASVMTALGKNRVELLKVIDYHILPKEESASELRLSPKTVEGDLLNLTGGVPRRTAHLITSDMEADNGKLNMVDQVLFPPEVFKELQRDGDMPIMVGLPIHSHMTPGSVNQTSPIRESTYAAARRRRARWNRIHKATS